MMCTYIYICILNIIRYGDCACDYMHKTVNLCEICNCTSVCVCVIELCRTYK